MSNRRMGMGGPRGGNRNFSQQPFQSGGGGLNPWQGGGNQMNQGGLLSQLTSNPQQLALALTSLLQPQQQQMNPPSLLSMNQPFNRDRDFGGPLGNRRDFRRHEPYNKNNRGGGWRGGDRNRNQNQRNQRNKNADRKDDKKKTDDKKSDKDKKDKKEESGDVSNDEDEKRDWKKEKNQKEDESGDEKDEEKKKEGRYGGVPSKYLNCFVCNKDMWDGESMGKHIKGRAHQQMMQKIEESVQITVNILRENMRLTEERKLIELNRMQRLKKYGKGFNDHESHCNMCDLKFIGKLIGHRRSEGHQRLKRYLHPRCGPCDKEFPSRIEWIEHRMTPEHLRKLHETLEKKAGGAEGDNITEAEEDVQEIELEPILEEGLQMEVDNPILELDENLDGLANMMPAYKEGRAVSTKSLKPFTGFSCDLCHRSFVEEKQAQNHLKTRRHYYQFIEALKRKKIEKEKKEKAERENAKKDKDQKDKEKKEKADESQNGDVEDVEGDGDQEMYDPSEATEEQDTSINEDGKDEAEGGDDDAAVEIKEDDVEVKEEEEVEELEAEEEPKPAPKKAGPAAKAAPAVKAGPASAKRAAAAAAAPAAAVVKPGPKSKKTRKQ